MKKTFLGVVMLLLGITTSAQNHIITHVLAGLKCTHELIYMPSGVVVTADGLKTKSYPIKLKPSETYVISEPINISSFKDMGVNYRYYVAKTNNHTMTIDLLNINDEVFASYELIGDINTSTKTIGGYFSALNFEEPIIKVKFRLTGAYTATEYANIDEFQLYGMKKEWNNRSIYLLTPIISKNIATIRWVSVDDAVKYDIIYKDEEYATSNTITITPSDSIIQTIELLDLSMERNYTYQIVAYNEFDEIITSPKSIFETTGIENINSSSDDINIKVVEGGVIVTTHNATDISVYNINGVAIIDDKKLTTGENKINLADGMYLLKPKDDEGKIIVVK